MTLALSPHAFMLHCHLSLVPCPSPPHSMPFTPCPFVPCLSLHAPCPLSPCLSPLAPKTHVPVPPTFLTSVPANLLIVFRFYAWHFPLLTTKILLALNTPRRKTGRLDDFIFYCFHFNYIKIFKFNSNVSMLAMKMNNLNEINWYSQVESKQTVQ